MKIFQAFGFGAKRKDYIEVGEPAFNATKELFETLKQRVSDLLSVIESKDNEIELLRRENLSLQARLTNLPAVVAEPPKRHFITVSAAKTELERRSLELKRNSEIKKSSPS